VIYAQSAEKDDARLIKQKEALCRASVRAEIEAEVRKEVALAERENC